MPSTSRTIYLLKRVELMLRNGLDAALAGTGVSVAHYVVLSLLKSLPNVSSAALSRRAGVTPQTMSETITAFERIGFITRAPSPEHRRILTIGLTASGLAKLADCEVRVDALEATLLRQVGCDDIDRLRRILRTILAAEDANETDTMERAQP